MKAFGLQQLVLLFIKWSDARERTADQPETDTKPANEGDAE